MWESNQIFIEETVHVHKQQNSVYFNNSEFDQVDKVGEGPLAEQEEILRRSMGVVCIVNVGLPGPNEDMTA